MKMAWCFRALLFLSLSTALPSIPIRADAQYLYLDLNGDGLNTSADVLNGLPVNASIYLRTDRNRDGSSTTCPSGPEPLSIGSLEFILHASAPVTWGALAAGGLFRGATITDHNATDFYAGYFDSTDVFLPPGQYQVGTLAITPVAPVGNPLLTFATSTSLSAHYLTSFGSQCRGLDDDYTLKLGREWHDAAGTFATLLATVSGTVFRDSNGTSSGNCQLDAGEPGLPGCQVTLNPGGQTVLTSYGGSYEFLNVLPGSYTISIAPPTSWNQTCPSGGAAQPVVVLPTQTYPNLNFGVRPANMPPALNPVQSQIMALGGVKDLTLTASDPDATPLNFSLLNGPSFASVTTTGPTTGNLHLAPQTSDAGTHALTVAASDGTFDSRRSATVRVLNATGVASDPTTGKFHVSLSANPINRTSALTFRTSRSGFIRAHIYGMNGRLVRTLKDASMAPPGRYELRIDGRDETGHPLASGVYFFKVETSEGSQVGRATVLK
jgi:SdrD B-like protein/flagellar hook capping protein FlgD